MRVYITGIGINSGIGNNTDENLKSLLNKKDGIGKITQIETAFKDEIPAAEVKLSDEALTQKLNLPEGAYTRTDLLGLNAAAEAVKNAGITDFSQLKSGLVSATTVAGMSKSEVYYQQYRDSDFSNRYIKTHEAAVSTERIAEYIGVNNFMTAVSTACSSSANAIMLAARMIKHGKLNCAVAGGTDSLSKFTLNGFNTLKILDRKACRPMDKSREGLNLGEGAAYLVLESEESIKKTGSQPIAELTGYANANDAHHQTASSPEGKGAFLAMQEALEVAGLQPKDISYINLHGTGTDNNDLTESRAIQNLFGADIPPLSSTKSYTGHTLAAAGAVEAVYSLLSIRESCLFPNLRFENPIEETGLIPVTEVRKDKEIKHVLSNSFGFGGNCTALIFSKIT
jgi:3-oxoacyl-[acyl-carrier-protein] synthase-1